MEPMGAIVHLHVLAVFTEGTCSLLSCWTRHFQELIPQDSGAHYKVHLKRIGSANSSRGGANSSGTGSLYREAQWVAAINAKIKHVHSTLRSDILSRQRRNATNEPAYFILTDLDVLPLRPYSSLLRFVAGASSPEILFMREPPGHCGLTPCERHFTSHSRSVYVRSTFRSPPSELCSSRMGPFHSYILLITDSTHHLLPLVQG